MRGAGASGTPGGSAGVDPEAGRGDQERLRAERREAFDGGLETGSVRTEGARRPVFAALTLLALGWPAAKGVPPDVPGVPGA